MINHRSRSLEWIKEAGQRLGVRDIALFDFFVFQSHLFHNSRKPFKHFVQMLWLHQYSTIKIGVILSHCVAFICPNVVHRLDFDSKSTKIIRYNNRKFQKELSVVITMTFLKDSDMFWWKIDKTLNICSDFHPRHKHFWASWRVLRLAFPNFAWKFYLYYFRSDSW